MLGNLTRIGCDSTWRWELHPKTRATAIYIHRYSLPRSQADNRVAASMLAAKSPAIHEARSTGLAPPSPASRSRDAIYPFMSDLVD